MIWGETGKPGYGLYDRALGAVYLNGLWKRSTNSRRRAERLARDAVQPAEAFQRAAAGAVFATDKAGIIQRVYDFQDADIV